MIFHSLIDSVAVKAPLGTGSSPSCTTRYNLLRLSFKLPANLARMSHLTVAFITSQQEEIYDHKAASANLC
jgi:hypothetical protein